MTRDPSLLTECVALQRALSRFPTLGAMHASPEWPELSVRLERVLSTVRLHPLIDMKAGTRLTDLEAGTRLIDMKAGTRLTDLEAGTRSSPDPPGPAAADRVRAVHWNIEHGNGYERVEAALRGHPELSEADVISLNEVDLGMARAGNRDVAGDLTGSLGRFGAWTPLFLETTPGRDEDPEWAGGRPNEEGLFGLAVLSRWPFGRVRRVELPSPERVQFDLERMAGRHVALVAEILRPGAPFVLASVHLEVHRTRAYRAAQMRVLLDALAAERRPVLIAGDFNSHTFDRGRPWDPLFGAAVLILSPHEALKRRLLHPDRGPAREPLFDLLARAGFAWEPLVDHAATLQLRLGRLGETRALFGPFAAAASRTLAWAERRAGLRLDWFAGRGWSGGRGFTVAGLDGPGRASDHAPIVAELW